MTAQNRTKNTAPAPNRARVLRFLDGIGVAEVLIFAFTVGIGVWSWLAYAVAMPQDFSTFAIVFLGVSVIGATVQMVMFAFVRQQGTFRERASFQSVTRPGTGIGIVFWGVPVLFAVALPAVTPPSTPANAFDPSMSIYQVMFVMVLLSLGATVFGAGVLFGLVVLPVAWIIAGALPERAPASGRVVAGTVSRGELVTGGLLLVAGAGFGVAMFAVAPAVTGGGSGTRMRMIEQLSALVTLQGNVVASVLVVLCVVAMVVLIVLNRRFAARRIHSATNARP